MNGAHWMGWMYLLVKLLAENKNQTENNKNILFLIDLDIDGQKKQKELSFSVKKIKKQINLIFVGDSKELDDFYKKEWIKDKLCKLCNKKFLIMESSESEKAKDLNYSRIEKYDKINEGYYKLRQAQIWFNFLNFKCLNSKCEARKSKEEKLTKIFNFIKNNKKNNEKTLEILNEFTILKEKNN